METGIQLVRLAEVAQFKNGGTPSRARDDYFSGTIPWLTGADLSGPIAQRARSYITRDAVANSAANLVPAGTLLLVTRTSVGKVAVAGTGLCFSQDITALIPDRARVVTDYLRHFLQSKATYLQSQARGATIKGVTREVVSRLMIPLPSITEQRRIANILDRADALCVTRREVLAHLDDLTVSFFVEMFGDPVRNERGWDRLPLREILSGIDSGVSPVCQNRPAEPGEWAVLKLGAVTRCTYLADENKALKPHVDPQRRFEVRVGDLLFSRKNTRDLVGACALVRETPPRRLLPDLIFRLNLRADAPINRSYLQQLLVLPVKRKVIQKLAGGSAGSMPNISKARLLAAEIELPPVTLQAEFSRRVDAIERYRATGSGAQEAAADLFAALQQRAFAGLL